MQKDSQGFSQRSSKRGTLAVMALGALLASSLTLSGCVSTADEKKKKDQDDSSSSGGSFTHVGGGTKGSNGTTEGSRSGTSDGSRAGTSEGGFGGTPEGGVSRGGFGAEGFGGGE